MKVFRIVLFVIVVSVLTTGCDSWLELKPENEIVLEDFWKSKADVESVLAGCYKSLSERPVIERMIVWGELRSDNMVEGRTIPAGSGLYDMRRILDGNLTRHNSYANWGPLYTTINYCNTLLSYAPEVREVDANFSQRDLNLVIGEATTLRALAYFYLVRAFRDIPLILDPSINDTQDYDRPQDDEETVLNFIIDDLNDILNKGWVRDSYGDRASDKGRITRSAVNALLADVYLWKEDYENCIKACDRVLADNNLRLVTDIEQFYAQVFYRGNSTESIFEIQFNERDVRNTAIVDLYSSLDNSRGYLAFPTSLGCDYATNYSTQYSPFNARVPGSVELEATSDVRSWSFIRYEGGDAFSIFKYGGANVYQRDLISAKTYSYRNTTANWIVYRLADVMLMKAEAMVQADKDWDEAFKLVNDIYLRASETKEPLVADNYSNKVDREELVLRERQRELMFEGKRWFDLVRLARRGGSVDRLNRYVTLKRSDSPAPLGALVMDALYMPIAKSELDANENFKQNPYYDTLRDK
ncbi:MAG: RagB/SusD family nutrient uptake outer membrane protein [Paludibacter sp.]|jgi:hypothetical protein|nr:RagB/SusD family nutrient uptake outer membrane protein [Bacteroidales bacterium]HOG04881.1 RagB/SusD family nutrient uptake outer membrane protein [Paludibacter sp.]HPM09190.1 RagB/SusD family nutrient uptake outer membrane protein [Paludibacter sp.]